MCGFPAGQSLQFHTALIVLYDLTFLRPDCSQHAIVVVALSPIRCYLVILKTLRVIVPGCLPLSGSAGDLQHPQPTFALVTAAVVNCRHPL